MQGFVISDTTLLLSLIDPNFDKSLTLVLVANNATIGTNGRPGGGIFLNIRASAISACFGPHSELFSYAFNVYKLNESSVYLQALKRWSFFDPGESFFLGFKHNSVG